MFEDTISVDLENDRSSFVEHAHRFWKLMKEATSKEANLETAANKEIVSRWAERGLVIDLLSPLLNSDSPITRYAAAAHLIDHGAAEQSIDVLRQLVQDPKGLIAPTARLLLIKRRIPLYS